MTRRHPSGYQPKQLRFENPPGRGQFELIDNPLSTDRVLQLIEQLESEARHHSVSVTGGEPLLHAPFLQHLLPALRSRGLRVYLETAGDLPKPAAALAQHRHLKSMLPSPKPKFISLLYL